MLYLLRGLNDALHNRYIDEHEFNNIKAFTNTIIGHFMKGKDKERMVDIMGGKIIYTEADKIYYKGREEGREEGKLEIIFEMVNEKALSKKEAALKLGVTQEELEEKFKNLKN